MSPAAAELGLWPWTAALQLQPGVTPSWFAAAACLPSGHQLAPTQIQFQLSEHLLDSQASCERLLSAEAHAECSAAVTDCLSAGSAAAVHQHSLQRDPAAALLAWQSGQQAWRPAVLPVLPCQQAEPVKHQMLV